MPWIGMCLDQTFGDRKVQLFLHALSSDTHGNGDLRRGLWFSSQGDGTQYLPSRAGQSKRLNQAVSLFQKPCVEPEDDEERYVMPSSRLIRPFSWAKAAMQQKCWLAKISILRHNARA